MKLGFRNAEIIRADYRAVLALDARIDPEMPLVWSVAVVELLHALDQIRRGEFRSHLPPLPIFVRRVGNEHGELAARIRMPGANFAQKADVGRLLEHARRTAMEAEREEVVQWNV